MTALLPNELSGQICQYELRETARPLIRAPKTRLVSTESSLLFQLIHLLNCTHTKYPEIPEKIKQTYHGFSFNVKEKYLQTYKYECTNLVCYKCGRM